MLEHAPTEASIRVSLLLLLAIAQAAGPRPFPQASISNGRIRLELYLPDAKAGYYRGTRFDWSGAVSSLQWNGHEYFGQWFDRYDPLIHDAITGPVEEFLTGNASSLGYDEAKPGETFVRIGVGVVRKPDEKEYRRFATYEILDAGAWAIDRGTDRIALTHSLRDSTGYAYVYRKTLRLDGNTLVLEHSLQNTGSKPIATSVYNHNFFTIDRQTTGPDFIVRFPFEPRPARPIAPLAEQRGREIAFLRELEPKQTVFTELDGFGTTAAHYGFELENRKTGAGVRVTGDRPLSKLLFWSAPKTICPEPYIDASVEPGRTSTWRTTYEFYQVKP